jgi:cyclin B
MKLSNSFQLKRKFGKDILNKGNIAKNKKNKNTKIIKKNDNKENFINIPKKKDNNEKNDLSIDPTNSFLKEIINITIKIKNNANPQFVYEYISDIIQYYSQNESVNVINYSNENIFKLQNVDYFNAKKRKGILEYLFYYNYRWKLNNDSMFLTANIMDRYINKVKINKNEYELIGLASFLIASKYEDLYSPDAKAISIIFSFKYNPEQILEKEKQILISLDFSLLYNSSHKYLHLIYHISEIDNENVFYFSELLLELSLTDLNLLKYSQKKRAIAAILFSKKIFGIKGGNYIIQFFFSYDENEMKVIQKEYYILLKGVIFCENRNLIAEKFRSSKYGFVYSLIEKKIKEKELKKEK